MCRPEKYILYNMAFLHLLTEPLLHSCPLKFRVRKGASKPEWSRYIQPAAYFWSDSPAQTRPKLSLVQTFRTTWLTSWLRSKFAFKNGAKGPGIEGICRELPWILGLDHLIISLAMVFTHCIYTLPLQLVVIHHRIIPGTRRLPRLQLDTRNQISGLFRAVMGTYMGTWIKFFTKFFKSKRSG